MSIRFPRNYIIDEDAKLIIILWMNYNGQKNFKIEIRNPKKIK
ncbi:MAG: hypothetical protein ACOYOV_07900 [Bacteroidales bacterium]